MFFKVSEQIFELQVGDAKYTINLENALSQDRMDRRCKSGISLILLVCMVSAFFF